MLEIEVLLTENELAEQFLAALRNRYLPEKFFYWFPLSVRAWLNLCNSAAPYKNFSRSYELIRKHAVEIAQELTGPSGKELQVVGLGAGQGDKDLLLLEALRAEGAKVSYQPVDSSQALLEIALESAASKRFPASVSKLTSPTPEPPRRWWLQSADPGCTWWWAIRLGSRDRSNFSKRCGQSYGLKTAFWWTGKFSTGRVRWRVTIIL